MTFYEFIKKYNITSLEKEHMEEAYKAGALQMYLCIKKACTFTPEVLDLIDHGSAIFNMSHDGYIEEED